MQNHKNQAADRNEEHRAMHRTLGANIQKLRDELIESELSGLVDFDGTTMKLFRYEYRMGNLVPFSVVVKKGDEDNKLTSDSYHSLLRIKGKFRLLLPIENFYDKGSNYNGWFVLSLVKGSLQAWLRTEGHNAFNGIGRIRDMAPIFRTMIIDLWIMLIDMYEDELSPERIELEDFFIKMLHGGAPRIQMLLTKLRPVRKPYFLEEWNRMWDDIDLFISRCCQICNVELSEASKRFCKYARQCTSSSSIVNVKNFPDNWTYDEKACYLYHMVSGTPFLKHVMRSKINEDSGLQWPKGSDGCNLHVITLILELPCNNKFDENGKKWLGSKYDTNKAYDYIQVFRNHHKHFDDLPRRIKQLLGGSRQGMIRCMENWEPNIWIMLYVAVGPAGRQLDG